jgi:hypothetical protein
MVEERPPLPQRIKPYVGRHRAKDWDDTDIVPSPVPRVPVWPSVDQDFPPVSGVLFDEPTVRFRPVRRFSWRWVKARLTWPRQVAGGMSALALLYGLYGWVNQ